ncbi:MAG: ATP:cob(I)alamin adenosyltransferase [Betaproteobacteria bacterium TMED156]|nr:MAG: ATP:cob(I)alamin adenosyltransferase [Betaproteobacteria bacterium TMED156]
MKSRISRVTTKTGDSGYTGISNGSRISKNHPLIHVLGDVDELNAFIGLFIHELKNSFKLKETDKIANILTKVQHILFDIGGEISSPGIKLVSEKKVIEITKQINELNKNLSPLKEFILPGGSKLSSLAHLSRTVARRAERNLVGFLESDDCPSSNIKNTCLPYLNRLSDLLFVISRCLMDIEKKDDVFWEKPEVN